MNPLKLDCRNRRFYEALVELHTTDTKDPTWLEKYRKVKRIKQVEGKAVKQGWRCFYETYATGSLPLEIAERFY